VCRTCFKTVDLPSPLMEGASSCFNLFLFFSSLSPYRRGGGEGWCRVSLRVLHASAGLGHNETRARSLSLSLSGPFLPAPARGPITPAQMFFFLHFYRPLHASTGLGHNDSGAKDGGTDEAGGRNLRARGRSVRSSSCPSTTTCLCVMLM
jgi:hypothetical protein